MILKCKFYKTLKDFLMKKPVILIFLLGFISAASAQEIKYDIPLKVGVNGIIYSTMYQGVYKEETKDTNGDYTAARIKPFLTFTDGNIEAMLKIEYDAVFGKTGTAADDTKSEGTGPGDDRKGLEVTQAYLKTKVDGIDGLTLTGGIANFDFPLVWEDDAPLANIAYSNDSLDFRLYYVKPSEGDRNKGDDDSQIYIADLTLKYDQSSLRPVFFAYQCKENPKMGQFRESMGYIYGLSFNLAIEGFGLDTSGAYINGKDKVLDVDYSAWAFDFAPYIKMNSIKGTGFLTMVSGDDDSTSGTNESFLSATIDGSAVSGINNWRLYIIEDAGSFTTYRDVADAGKYTNTNGYLAVGLSIDATLGPLTARLLGAYAQAIKTVSGRDKEMGYEADLNIGYALTRSSTFYVEGAFLVTGDYYEGASGTDKTQYAKYVNFGMTYSL